jgi:Rrf2 family protein
MFVTREADYAVRAVLHLAGLPGEVVPRSRIARIMRVPDAFLAKILQRLQRERIVVSVRGVQGGFRLARPPKAISLLEVLEAVQGKQAASACALRPRSCRLSGRCAVHRVWVEVRKETEARLRRETFARLLEDTQEAGRKRDGR